MLVRAKSRRAPQGDGHPAVLNRHTGKVPIAQAEGHHAPALVYEVTPGRAAVPVGGSHPLVRREEERAADAIERYLDAAGDEALPRRDPLHAWPPRLSPAQPRLHRRGRLPGEVCSPSIARSSTLSCSKRCRKNLPPSIAGRGREDDRGAADGQALWRCRLPRSQQQASRDDYLARFLAPDLVRAAI